MIVSLYQKIIVITVCANMHDHAASKKDLTTKIFQTIALLTTRTFNGGKLNYPKKSCTNRILVKNTHVLAIVPTYLRRMRKKRAVLNTQLNVDNVTYTVRSHYTRGK
jgi:hypothetical protein